ncbi:MAG: Wzz/FepE/Etk N-terminal domain-containing protein [Candidatus Acidiferrales bacterium]
MTQPTEDLAQTLERVYEIAVRRRWWFVLTACIVAIGAIAVSFVLPNRYKSEATILVEQQQVPERYVVPNSTTNLNQVLQAMTQDVLSRTRLLKIISDYGLYQDQRKRLGPEQLVELMRTDIEIKSLEPQDEGAKGADAFKISYIGRTPEAALQVTNRLTSLFINEDLKTQQQRDVNTTNFLQAQLATAQADLDKKEERLRDFKMANLGELPEQQQGNLQILDGLQMQLQNTNAALARANEQHAYLQSLLAQYRNLTVATGVAPGALNASPVETVQAELTHLRSERATLLGSYSAEYPDVKKIDSEIAENEALLTRLEKSRPTPQGSASSSSTTRSTFTTTDSTVAQLNSQLKQNQLEITNDSAQAKQIQEQVDEYQHRLNLTPVREQQLTDILRGYDLAKKNYDDLYSKKTQSALATDLQQDQQGEQFRLIDPPNLPSKPFTPNRLKIALGGVAGGLALGVGLAFLMEVKDASLHSEKELRARFVLPIVMGVPLFITAREKRMRSIKSVMQWCAGAILLLAVLAAEYYVYRRG